MSRQTTRDTAPELRVRRWLHSQGYRYRVHVRPVSGVRRAADVVFTRKRVAIFVDGCFWHGCPAHGTSPKRNKQWWMDKLAGNVQRDTDTDCRLREAGWTVVRIWEHEEIEEFSQRLRDVLRSGSHGSSGG
jgi:DNA mismatch endonuclease (patch repair protein)